MFHFLKKTFHNSDDSPAAVNVPDLQKFGDPDRWRLICKASSQSEGWMKSTKAMEVAGGVLVQVTTQQGNNVAEALTYVPYATIEEKDGIRSIVKPSGRP